MKASKAVNNFINFYQNFNLNDIDVFNDVYSDKVTFQDPFHTVRGRDELYNYFKKMMMQVSTCSFEIQETAYVPGGPDENSSAIITWDMHFGHKKLNKGKAIKVCGATHIVYEEKVIFHKDYFDSSQLIYKNIPILGSLIRIIEKGI